MIGSRVLVSRTVSCAEAALPDLQLLTVIQFWYINKNTLKQDEQSTNYY